MLSSHLCLDFPSGLFPSGFPPQTLYTPLLSPIRSTCHAHLILLDFITQSPAQHILKLRTNVAEIHFNSFSCHLNLSSPFHRNKDCMTAATFCTKLSKCASQPCRIRSGLFTAHFVMRYSNGFTHALHEQINEALKSARNNCVLKFRYFYLYTDMMHHSQEYACSELPYKSYPHIE
jgi:hypothetical protein